MTLTIRAHLEAIRDGHTNVPKSVPGLTVGNCLSCSVSWPCWNYLHALAALKALDEAHRPVSMDGQHARNLYRLVPDPAPPTEN